MCDKLDETKGRDFKAGGYAVAPAHMNHFAWTKAGAKSGVGTERYQPLVPTSSDAIPRVAP
jgi:hypothetical protein